MSACYNLAKCGNTPLLCWWFVMMRCLRMMILSLPSHDDCWMLQGDHFCRDCSVMQTASLFVRCKCLQFVFFPNWISFPCLPAAVSNITTGPVCVSIVCRLRPGSCLRCFVSSGPSWRHDLQQSGPATGESHFTSLLHFWIARYSIFAHIPFICMH